MTKQLQLNIKSAESYDIIRQAPVIAGNSAIGYYVFHAMTTWNVITVNGVGLYAKYSNGDCYYHYDCPSNEFSLCSINSNEVLRILDKLVQSEIVSETEEATNALEQIKELLPVVDTIDKLLELYLFFIDNHPRNSINYLEDGHSFDTDDYEENEDFILTLIEKNN